MNPLEDQQLKYYPIIIMSKRFVDIFYQLIELGVSHEKIDFGICLFPETERELKLAEYGCFKVKNNYLIYNFFHDKEVIIHKQDEIEELMNDSLRRYYREKADDIILISKLKNEPVSRDWGMSRGRAIDRVYIERFLEKNKEDIHGTVLEIADNKYTLQYGETRVKESKVLHVRGWNGTLKGNLETGEGLEREQFDTVILTQTLMFIYDLKSAVNNLYRIMKKNGTALVTVSGISQISRYDADRWGSFWGFHKNALERLFIPLFGVQNVEIQSFGNVKVAAAMLYGMCAEEIGHEAFEIQDPDYPVISTVRLKKK